MSILDELQMIKVESDKARKLAAKEYAEIIARHAKPRKGDAAALDNRLMPLLGRTAEDIVRDIEAYDTVQAESKFLNGDTTKLIEASEAAIKAELAATEQWHETQRALRAKSNQAYLERSNAEERTARAKKTVDAITKSSDRCLAFGVLPEDLEQPKPTGNRSLPDGAHLGGNVANHENAEIPYVLTPSSPMGRPN